MAKCHFKSERLVMTMGIIVRFLRQDVILAAAVSRDQYYLCPFCSSGTGPATFRPATDATGLDFYEFGCVFCKFLVTNFSTLRTGQVSIGVI